MIVARIAARHAGWAVLSWLLAATALPDAAFAKIVAPDSGGTTPTAPDITPVPPASLAVPPVTASPGLVFSPQITVPAALPPAITVQVPAAPADPTRMWAVLISVFSAVVSVISAGIAYGSQRIGFRKDAAAIVRDIRAKEAAAALQAFENNVGRPLGMALDLLEDMTRAVTRLSAAPEPAVPDELRRYGVELGRDHAMMTRLCGEADGGLTGGQPIFAPLYARAGLDDSFLAAARQELSGTRPSLAEASAFDKMMADVRRMKIELRRLLETERAAEIRRGIGGLTSDPYYPELRRWLGDAILSTGPVAPASGSARPV